jgi:abortive infection bacteriophage resistance protein
MYPFLKRSGTEEFLDGTHFTDVLHTYVFDKKLRHLLQDMCERIEVSVKANMCNIMALKHGPHWYPDSTHFRDYDRHQEFLAEVEEYCEGCHDPFIKHYMRNYHDSKLPPIWMIIQTLTFGQTSRLYDNLKPSPERSAIANCFDITPRFFELWLKSINFIRNCCAHHSRLWNRHIPQKPILPEDAKYRFLITTNEDTNHKMFGTMSCMLAMLLKINSKSSCKMKLKALFDEYVDISLDDMGFTRDWEESKVWKN